MSRRPSKLSFCTILLAATLSQGVMAAGAGPHWSYTGESGPDQWGDLSENYSMCKQGSQQSPIDISQAITANRYPLAFHYRANPLQLINNGHTLQNNYNDATASVPVKIGAQTHRLTKPATYSSYMMVGPQRYDLLQLHFHTPSEHAQSGVHYPMEVHLVHQNSANALAVIAVYFRQGKENTEVQKLIDNLPKISGETHTVEQVSFNANHLLPAKTDYVHYSGSLTTPPCSEDVKWFVLQEPIEASAAQLQRMRAVMGRNARPLQSINWRDLIHVDN